MMESPSIRSSLVAEVHPGNEKDRCHEQSASPHDDLNHTQRLCPVPSFPQVSNKPSGRKANIAAFRHKRARPLTDKEQAVVDCVMEGLSNAAIAYRLGIVESTVDERLIRIKRNWHIDSRRYLLRLRIIYVESQRLGLLPGWPIGKYYYGEETVTAPPVSAVDCSGVCCESFRPADMDGQPDQRSHL